jgi:type IV pilus assembly protein PilM
LASSAVGIDIGTRTLTVAEVTQGRGGSAVTNFGGIALPADAVREGEVVDAHAVAESLAQLLRTTGIASRKVWLGISNQRVVVRQVDLPWMPEKELREALRYRVQEFIPIPVEEAELDVHVTGETTGPDGERMQRLLLVAGHRDMVTSHVDAATLAGLQPVGVDLNPFAVLRAMGARPLLDQGSQVLVDIGAGVTNIVVQEAGVPTFVRILVMGGDDLTSSLVAGLSITTEEAEVVKCQVRVGDELDVASRIVTEQVDRFIDEVRSSLEYHQAQSGDTRFSGVVLCGGGSLLAGLDARLAAALRLPVELGNPLGDLPVKGSVHSDADLARVGPVLATAVGLALGGLE